MITTRTPFRISFFGGGTDYPVFYREHGGAVLSTTINKYCYITVRYLPPFFNYTYRLRYTKTETTNSIDAIQHPSVRECLKFCRLRHGIEMVHTSDIPALSGIGSSSAFTVGLLHAFYGLQGRMASKRKLGMDAISVEQDWIGESVGSQDQIAAAFGGFNKIVFEKNSTITVHPLTVKKENLAYLQRCLMFYFTGFSRYASEIAETQIRETPKKVRELMEMRSFVDDAVALLSGSERSLNAFGKLLHESWMIKRELTNKISTREIDEIYEHAIAAGALGGKVCGAGGGGFLVFFVPPENQPQVRKALKNFLLVPVDFDHLGSHVVFYAPEEPIDCTNP